MDTNAVVLSAAVGAVVAAVTAIAVDRHEKAKNIKASEAEIYTRIQAAQNEAWWQGRESVLQHFQNAVEPQHFTTSS